MENGVNRAKGVSIIDRMRVEPLVLTISPTQELTTQIFDETRCLCYHTMVLRMGLILAACRVGIA